MYYNIKIKSNGSEFSLESNNKEVTQREMDMYFAHIFDVSEDFKSQIKKVEIKNANVKSIEEIENFATNSFKEQLEVRQPIQQPTQIPTQAPIPSVAPTYAPAPSEIPTHAPKQILPEIKITSTPIQPQVQRIVDEKPDFAQNMQQPLPQVSLQNVAQPIIQNYNPTPINNQQQVKNLNMQDMQLNHQPTQAEIENLLNKYIETSLEPSTPNQKNPLQESPTLQSYFDSISMPSEEIKEEYEHQKEVLEIKFDNIPSFKNQEGGYGYGEVSTKNIEIELQEIEELDSIQPISYAQYQQEIEEQPSQNEVASEQIVQNYNFNEPETIQTVPSYNYNEVQAEQTIPQPIYTEPKIIVKSEPQTSELAPAIQNDIDELISLAQNKLDSFDMDEATPRPQITIKEVQEVEQTYETVDFDLSNSKFANLNSYQNSLAQEKEQYQSNNQEKINQIFANEQPQTTKAEYQPEQNAHSQQIQEIFQEEYETDDTPAEIDIKNEASINLGNIEMDFESEVQGMPQAQLAKGEYREYTQEERQQILSTPELVAPTINIPTMSTPIMNNTPELATMPTQISQITQSIPQAPQPIQELPTQVAIQPQNIQQLSQGSYTQDFKLYLNEFNCETQSDHFLICAFYIKNILKQENFTMKSINSKLFQATGAIADLGILDDLISKAYIRVINTPEAKKYCITPDGEGYFVSRFQR